MMNRKTLRSISKFSSFFYAAITSIKVSFIGQIGSNEIFASLNLLSIGKWKKLNHGVPDLKIVNYAYILFLISQILSDLVNHSTLFDSARGLANIVVAIIVTSFLMSIILKRSENIIYFLIGLIVSYSFFGIETHTTEVEDMGFLKFRLAPILNASLLLIVYYLHKIGSNKLYQFLILIGYSIFCLLFDFRSNGIIFMLLAISVYSRNFFLTLSMTKVFPKLLIGAILFQVFYSIYVSEVLTGNIGGKHSRIQLALLENPYNPFNLLLVGRSGAYIAVLAIMDKPVFGHGSWAPDPGGKYTLLNYKLQQEDEKFAERFDRENGRLFIPSHSVILGAWVTAGFFGFISIVIIMFLFYKRAFLLLRFKSFANSPYYLIVIYYMASNFWTFLFSPLPHIRESIPITLAFVLVLFRKHENFEKVPTSSFI
ncbi:hypothetical protein [Salmonirosea aquatica]|uniref:Oligosaccharide repeat unit polymerase n=1 Tax=Salmonirosea aquatica TaxID=2654236 RepID=A0A7C9F714_9BACT|nr:hypothetical protein [Cytophagaceae bacterium SJW1-29]